MAFWNRNQEDDDWAQQIPWERGRGPYRDYGWEKGQSVLPEFRDSSNRVMPYERDRISRWRDVDWDEEFDRGMVAGGPYSGVGPKGYQRSDQRIFDEVCERLTQHGQIDARGMEVNVKDGEVILTGTVDSRHAKRMAEDVAESVHGVQDIDNQLRIQKRGIPGEGRGRVDRVGRSGVYPASGPLPPGDAEVQDMASWGQGERGTSGRAESGRSEVYGRRESQRRRR